MENAACIWQEIMNKHKGNLKSITNIQAQKLQHPSPTGTPCPLSFRRECGA
jgi:hypothetical protein